MRSVYPEPRRRWKGHHETGAPPGPAYRLRHRLLRACRERPRRRAAEQRNELAALHSITSSARASREGGTSRPSALAVLRLTTRSYLVGPCTGLEHAGDIAGGNTVPNDEIGAVGHQAAGGDVKTIRVDRRQSMPRRLRDDKLSMHVRSRTDHLDQTTVRALRECADLAFDLVGI